MLRNASLVLGISRTDVKLDHVKLTDVETSNVRLIAESFFHIVKTNSFTVFSLQYVYQKYLVYIMFTKTLVHKRISISIVSSLQYAY